MASHPVLARDITTKDSVYTTPSTDILDALFLMLKNGRRILSVLQDGRFAGTVTVASYVKVIQSLDSRKPESFLISEIMNESAYVASPNTELIHVVDRLCGKGIYGVPIISGHDYMGIIRRQEVLTKFLHLLKGKFKAMDVMSYNVSTCSIHDALETLARRIASGIERRIIVMNDDRIEGMVTFEDMINVILADKSDISNLSVRDVLVPIQVSMKKSDDAAKAAQLLLDWGINAVPVVDEGNLEGIIRDKDILQRIHALM
jgi:predicted transcriptional regulator